MSPLFNDLSAWHIEQINDALVTVVSQTPDAFKPLGRALARASERYFDAAFLASYGDADEAAALLTLCRRHLVEALNLLDTPPAAQRANFAEHEAEA